MFAGVSNNDSVEAGKGYVEDLEVPYAMANAPDVWDAYEVPYQPVTVVIGADGTIADRFDGPITYEALKESLDASL